MKRPKNNSLIHPACAQNLARRMNHKLRRRIVERFVLNPSVSQKPQADCQGLERHVMKSLMALPEFSCEWTG